jgi:hypothetical protein
MVARWSCWRRAGQHQFAWACARLHHPGYDAREDVASLLGDLAERGQLGGRQDTVAQELAALAIRPWEEDTKEVQANTAALHSLARIGGPAFLGALRMILLSSQWDDDDLQWDAAQLLSGLTGGAIGASGDPVKAAKDWLRSQPEVGSA